MLFLLVFYANSHGYRNSLRKWLASEINSLYYVASFAANVIPIVTKGCALIAQSVEQRIENPRVPGSIPGQGTIFYLSIKN